MYSSKMETVMMEKNREENEDVSEMNVDKRTGIRENPHSVLKRKVQLPSSKHPLSKHVRTGNAMYSDLDSVTSDHVDSTGAATTYPGGSCMLHTDRDLAPSAVGFTVASNDAGCNNNLQKAPHAESTRILPTSSLVNPKRPLKLHRCRICLKIFAGADFLSKHVAEKHSKESKEQTSIIPERVDEMVGPDFRGNNNLEVNLGHCELTVIKQEFQDVDVKKEVQANLEKELGHNDLDPERNSENGRQVVPEKSLEVLSLENLEVIQPPRNMRKKAMCSDDKEKLEEQRKDCYRECQEGINDSEQSEINKILNFKAKFCKTAKTKPGHSRGTPIWCEICGLRFITPESLRRHQAQHNYGSGPEEKEKKLEGQRKEGEDQDQTSDNEESKINKIRNFTTKFCKIKSNHWLSGRSPLWCVKCGLRFITAESLTVHQAKNNCVDTSRPTVTSTGVTAFEASNSSERPQIVKNEAEYHWCATCALPFTNEGYLKRHLLHGHCKFSSGVTSAKPTVLKEILIPSKKESSETNQMNPVVVLHDCMKGAKQTSKATFRIISANSAETSLKKKVLVIAEGQGSGEHLSFKLQPSGEGLGKKTAARIKTEIKTEAETANEAECESEARKSAKINLGPVSEAFFPVKIKQEKTDIDGDPSDKLDKMPVETSVNYGCNFCDMAFPTESSLKSHMPHHGRHASRGFVCDVCNIKFTEIEAFLVHQKRENHYLIFACYFCETECVGQVGLDQHLSEHHKGRSKSKPRCLFCNMEFVKERDRDIHTRTHLRQLLLCEICDLGFLKQGNLTKHLSTHSQDDIHCCRICAEHFGGVNELMNHMETHSISNVNSYVPGYFKDHVKFHPGTKKPYICNICHVSYSHSGMYALINHLIVHQQQKSQYDCRKCWMHFITRLHLYKHKCLQMSMKS